MKRNSTLPLILLGMIILFSACKKDKTDPIVEEKVPDPKVVVESVTTKLATVPTASIFTEVLKGVTLSAADVSLGLTVFAPTNTAVSSYNSSLPRKLSYLATKGNTAGIKGPNSISAADSNSVKLSEAVLKDHIVKGVLKPEDLVDGKTLVSLSGKNLKVTREGSVIKINGVTLTTVAADGTQSVFTVGVVLSSTETVDADRINVILPVAIVSKEVVFSSTPNDTVPVKGFRTTTANITYLSNTTLPLTFETVNGTNYNRLSITYNASKVPTSAIKGYKNSPQVSIYKTNGRYDYVTNTAGEVTRQNIFNYVTDTVNGSNIGKYDYTYDSQNRLTTIAKAVPLWDEAYTMSLTYGSTGNLSTYSSRNITASVLTFDTKNGIFKNVKKLYLLDRDTNYPWGYFSVANNLIKVTVPGSAEVNVAIEYNADNYPSKVTYGEDVYTITYKTFSVFK
ncbi:fasciclin domain-containing protein [Pedobacter sp. PWIIR3]